MADRGQHPLTADDVIRQSNNITTSLPPLQPEQQQYQQPSVPTHSSIAHPVFDVEGETNA